MIFITAEIGINHNGDLKIAKDLIKIAKSCGCDAVKFQKRTVEKSYSKEILDSFRDSPYPPLSVLEINRDASIAVQSLVEAQAE